LKTAAEAGHILDRLEAQHPEADTELRYRNAFELLVAAMLSAQSTDQRVNLVTPDLFGRFPDAHSMARASESQLQPLIHSTGFFRAKSRALVGMARALVARHQGEVPRTMEALTALPGVGRKTANVVLGHALGVPGLPVDRHVLRVSNRIGIADGADPEVVEQQLSRLLPRERWTLASDTLILHGRRICRPKPLCSRCAVQDACWYFQSGVERADRAAEPEGRGRTRRQRSASHTRRRRAGPRRR
jgi:endonuclease-3